MPIPCLNSWQSQGDSRMSVVVCCNIHMFPHMNVSVIVFIVHSQFLLHVWCPLLPCLWSLLLTLGDTYVCTCTYNLLMCVCVCVWRCVRVCEGNGRCVCYFGVLMSRVYVYCLQGGQGRACVPWHAFKQVPHFWHWSKVPVQVYSLWLQCQATFKVDWCEQYRVSMLQKVAACNTLCNTP